MAKRVRKAWNGGYPPVDVIPLINEINENHGDIELGRMRIEKDPDLSGFKKQEITSKVPGIYHEWVTQTQFGEDTFSGTLAYDLHDGAKQFLMVDFYS